jgi:putative peptidoglycan lipid II flippase
MASVILVVTLTLSNVLGMLRDHFLARSIPTSELDIYFAAFRIPDLIFNFLILGAISSAFIPVFCEFIAQKKLDEGFRVTNVLLNLAMGTLIACAIVLFFVMPYLTPFVVPHFDVEKMKRVTELSRLLMITPIFFAVSYILSGVLNSFKRFLAYSTAPLVYNLSIIAGAIFIAPRYGILGVVYFVIIGAALHALVQLPTAYHLGFRYRLIADIKNEAVRRIVQLMLPRTVGMGVNQIMLIVYTAIASALTTGSISAFNFANNIQTMPVVVFGTSFATAVFPTLTTVAAQKDYKLFSFYLSRSVRTIAFILIPISLFFILLRAQIIRLILGSGQFEWSDTKLTALTLGYFSLSLIAQGLVPLLARAFYAVKNTRTPMYISIVTVIVSVVLGYVLAPAMGVPGLALAFTSGSFFNAAALYLFLNKELRSDIGRKVLSVIVKIILISLVSAAAVWVTMHLMANIVNMNTFLGVLWQTLTATGAGVLIYLLLAYLLDFEEIAWAMTRKVNGLSHGRQGVNNGG